MNTFATSFWGLWRETIRGGRSNSSQKGPRLDLNSVSLGCKATVLHCWFLHFTSHSAPSQVFKVSLPVPVVQHSPCLYWTKVMYCLLSGSIILKTTSRLESSNRFGPITPLCWDSFSCSSFSIRNSLGFSEKIHKKQCKTKQSWWTYGDEN